LTLGADKVLIAVQSKLLDHANCSLECFSSKPWSRSLLAGGSSALLLALKSYGTGSSSEG
jgi:hypothetical protein